MNALVIKEFMEKSADAAKRSLAMRESRRNRQGYYVGRQTATQEMQANRRRGDAGNGMIGRGQEIAGSRHGVWNPLPMSQAFVSKMI